MDLDYLVQTLATIAGVTMSFGYYPQAWKIFRTKSADNISLSAYSIFIFGTTTWFLYGLYERSLVIALSFVFGVVGSWLVLLLTLYYRGKQNS